MELTQRWKDSPRALPARRLNWDDLGKAAGAGVADHIHMHILPRWFGDVISCSSVAERVCCRKICDQV